ncbi:ATP-binding protein [Cytobacillus sp. IB215316]|uniref:ATP-binding protein n=1 Tax=Cytobacillus sp. IB215316 TaxID=3097354 RepID=UPI002A145F8E|nr:ATP-binding protein [Cytobacillus sp. IB215316]MDX8360401.1 ATP-binding protein [Cytobacillus sp. IB215316]
MLAETLFLHVLIIFAPVLFYFVIFENKKLNIFNPYIYGLMQGTAAALCMLFSTYNFGLYWDLRYVPLVLSFLYGGPISGGIVVFFIIMTRTYMGGEALFYGYISVLLAATIPMLFSMRFWNFEKRKRIVIAVIVSFWPAFIQLGILVSWLIFDGSIDGDVKQLLFYIIIFGIILNIGIGFAAKLYEVVIERERMKQEIQNAEKLNTIGELAASIAHEIRNPLTVVKGFLQLMEKQQKSENQEYLRIVLSELGRAESTISDYLNFAEPQFEKVESFPLNEVIIDVCKLLEPFASKEDIQLKISLNSSDHVLTDRNQIKQAFVNIIKNAIEASENGESVNITVTSDGMYFYIIIKDTGKGMTKEQLNRLGTLFYTTKDKGTGLGTMVSIRIIQSMDGRISFESQPGVGTEVKIIIPQLR